MPMGWRIASPTYGSSTRQMLSGEGAFLFGGRWNSKGTRTAYLGSSIAQASMELLVHLGRADVLNQYHIMSVEFDESDMEYIDPADLPSDWREASMASSVQAVGDDWVSACSSLILQVPSAAVPQEYNYLLNPVHPRFESVNCGSIDSYQFDPRVLKG